MSLGPEDKHCGAETKCSAAVPAAVVGASRPHRRGQDALATAGKMPALPGWQQSQNISGLGKVRPRRDRGNGGREPWQMKASCLVAWREIGTTSDTPARP